MSHIEQILFPTNGPNFDAFARLRVSNPEAIFDSKQIHDASNIFWDDQEVSGSGTTSVYSQNEANYTIGVAATTAGKRVRQTFRRFNYQPGKSQLILLTGTVDYSGGGAGITRGFGYGDEENGIFLVDKEGTINFRKRSYRTGSAVDTDIAQSSWNLDTMDGNGPSAITLDFSKSQILIIDLEWLGVGRIRIGFVIDGQVYYCHQFLHANNVAGVYMSTPNLPVRYFIENDGTGAASTLEHICSSVISEGGTDNVGTNRSNSNGATAVVAATAGTTYALCGIRLKAANIDGVVKLVNASILELNAVDYLWQVYANPTLAGAAPSWVDQADSVIQFAVGVAANTVTGGNVVFSQYVKGGKESGASGDDFDTEQLNGSLIDGTPQELWLTATPLAINADFVGALTWREIS